jgi:hypothetical protein
MRSMVLAATAAAAIVSAGSFWNAAGAADFSQAPEAPPPTAEAAPPPPAYGPPVAVAPRPPAVVLVEPQCPTVWRCGYWGCGWRRACGPVGPEVYVGPRPWGYYGYGAYRTYHGPYWGHGQRWGHWRHWS